MKIIRARRECLPGPADTATVQNPAEVWGQRTPSLTGSCARDA